MAPLKRPAPSETPKREEPMTPHGPRCVCVWCRSKRKAGRVLTAALMMLCLWPMGGEAHPGRLDKTGCHHVRKDFRYTSGKVAPRGQYHCHRLLSGERLVPAMILDGREVLMDSRQDVEREEEDEHPEEAP